LGAKIARAILAMWDTYVGRKILKIITNLMFFFCIFALLWEKKYIIKKKIFSIFTLFHEIAIS
jgi:hypothetical protein